MSGNSHYYVMLEGTEEIFDVSVVDFIDIIKYEVGEEVTIEYKKGEESNTVLSLNGKERKINASEKEKAEKAANETTE